MMRYDKNVQYRAIFPALVVLICLLAKWTYAQSTYNYLIFMLRRKQQQVLQGKESLDLGEDVHRMSEPE